jgi:hypothetical protein
VATVAALLATVPPAGAALLLSAVPSASLSHQISLSGANQTIASASNQALNANQFTANYTQVIPPGEAMLVRCL